MATEKRNNSSLQKLSGSNYEIADGQPDISGWDVRDENGKRIGDIDDLLFDEQSRKVRYLVVDLADNGLDLDDKK
ncbi:MAG TPA: PRC-barrel domain-containing protein, partial [Flavisolibacter sp.]